MEAKMTLGTKLKHTREELKLTQQNVADRLNIKREQISYFENGGREVSLSLLSKLAEIYGKTLTYFLNDDIQNEDVIRVAYRNTALVDEDYEKIEWAKKFVTNLYEMNKLLKR